MKKLLQSTCFLVLFGCLSAYAVSRKANDPTSSLTWVGDSFVYTRVTLSSSTATNVSAYSLSRAHLVCHNIDTTNAVFVGSSTTISPTSASFQIEASPNTTSRWETYSVGDVYMIAAAGIGTSVVNCIEER